MSKNTKTIAPVGTVRKFVSEQYLSDYKIKTLDSAYASKTNASTSVAGIVQLNDTVNSTSTSQAATANAVKKAYDLANGKANASHGNHVPATQTADARKFLRNDNTWQILPSGTTSATGIVQLSDAVNSTSTTLAATANAVKKAYDLANTASKINDSTIATNSAWSSSKTQIEINNSYNTMSNKVDALEESVNADFVSKRGDTINGDLIIKKSDGGASKIKVYRTLDSKEIEGCVDIYAHNGGSVSLSTWNRTNNVQTSSYIFAGNALYADSGSTGVTPDLGLQDRPFGKGWFDKLQVTSAMYTEGEVTLRGRTNLYDPVLYNNRSLVGVNTNGSKLDICGIDTSNNIYLGWNNQTYINVNNTMRVHRDIQILNGSAMRITGQLVVSRTESQAQMAIITTAGDGNAIGDGNTHLGYYQSGNGGYGHYFRGSGSFVIDNTQSLQINASWMKLGGKKLTISSGTPSGAASGDIWIQI